MKEKLQNMWLTVRRYWQRPQKGETVAYKEVAAYSVGAMGVKSFGSLLTYIQMAPTCLLIASVYGLSPTDIMWLFIVTNVVGVIKTPFVSMLQDNTNTPLGKFRPYMLWAGIPCVLTTLLPWVCAYQLGNSGLTGIVQTITSVGFTPGIILAPIIIAKLGARKGGFIFAMGNAVAAAIMFFTFRQGFAFFVISLFIYNFALGPQYIMQTTVMSDGFDAQQLKEDARIEGFANNFQVMITTIGSIISTVVFTFVYESNGLVADEVTGVTDYTVLTNPEIREPIISTLILIVIGASVLTALPYLFVTLNAEKMKGIRAQLERKKFITDNGLQEADEEEIERAYGAFLAEKEKEEEAAAQQARREKQELAEKQKREREAQAALAAEKRAIYDNVLARGGSAGEARRAAAQPEKREKARKKAERRAMMNKLKEDYRALRARKKAFCAEWIAAAKAEGKKKWLRVLASEAFADLLAQESLREAEKESGESAVKAG